MLTSLLVLYWLRELIFRLNGLFLSSLEGLWHRSGPIYVNGSLVQYVVSSRRNESSSFYGQPLRSVVIAQLTRLLLLRLLEFLKYAVTGIFGGGNVRAADPDRHPQDMAQMATALVAGGQVQAQPQQQVQLLQAALQEAQEDAFEAQEGTTGLQEAKQEEEADAIPPTERHARHRL